MDNQNRTSGPDGHGVYICHSCGWPFPNPNPSARHRRAHKKICGTIDGYKVIDSRGSSFSTLPDDERLSDEDHKTPSPHSLEGSNDEKKSSGSGLRTNNTSEDEAFVDAVAEFSHSGSGKGIGGSSDDVKKPVRFIETSLTNDTKIALSFEDDAITAIVPPSRNYGSSQNTDSQGNIQSADALESRSQPSHVTIASVGSSETDCRTNKAGHGSSDEKHSSTSNPNPVQVESRVNVSQENMKKIAWEDLEVADVMGNQDHNKKNNALDDLVETDIKGNEKAIPTSEAVSLSGKIEDLTSDNVTTAGVIELKEQCDDDLDSNKYLNVPSSEVDSIGHANTYFSTAQNNASATGEMASEGSGKLTEIANESGEVNDNFHVFSFSDEMPVLKNPETMIEGYKDHRAGTKLQLVDADSFEVINIARDLALIVKPSNSLSCLSDEGKELFASGAHISKDNIPQEDGNSEHVEDSVCKVNASSLSDEGEQLLASDTHFSGDSMQQGGGNGKNVTEKYSGQTEQLKAAVNKDQITEESCVHKDAAANEVENINTVQCPQEQLRDDYPHILSKSVSLEHGAGFKSDMAPVAALVDLEVRQASDLDGTNDAADCESCRSVTTKSEDFKRIGKDGFFGRIMATAENFFILSGGKVHESSNFSESKNALDDDKGKVESNYGSVVNASSEPELLLLNKASDSQETVIECGTNDKRKVLVEGYSAGVSDSVGDVRADKIDDFEVLQKSTEEQMIKESPLSPLNVSSSIQNSANVSENPAGDSVEAGPENQAESRLDDGENKLVAQQLGASAADFSIDSGSQTDSLEGHGGSVSVVSSQSDIQATVDMESAACGSKSSAEAGKAVMEKTKISKEGAQQTEKTVIFEAPSFVTLVDPRDDDKAISADEVQTAQNLQQSKDAQAVWFPSLVDVVNESQERKKNEEIIAKVTNWSTAKQHAPLKNLLGEVNNENKSMSPSVEESQPLLVQKDDPKPTVLNARDNTAAAPTAKPLASPQMTAFEPVKKYNEGKEWDSPARYPADLKREKRKAKGKPYWAQCMCCSSVN